MNANSELFYVNLNANESGDKRYLKLGQHSLRGFIRVGPESFAKDLIQYTGSVSYQPVKINGKVASLSKFKDEILSRFEHDELTLKQIERQGIDCEDFKWDEWLGFNGEVPCQTPESTEFVNFIKSQGYVGVVIKSDGWYSSAGDFIIVFPGTQISVGNAINCREGDEFKGEDDYVYRGGRRG